MDSSLDSTTSPTKSASPHQNQHLASPLKFRSSAGAAARRRRVEIRRFRLIANTNGFVEPVFKRPRCSSATSPASSAPSLDIDFSITFGKKKKIMGDNELFRNGWHQKKIDSVKPVALIVASAGSEEEVCLSSGISSQSSDASRTSLSSSGSSDTFGSPGVSGLTTATTGSEEDEAPPKSSPSSQEQQNRLSQAHQQNQAPDLVVSMDVDAEQDGILASAAKNVWSGRTSPDCVEDNRCPPHGVVYICGRRREMEDAVAVVPSFMSVPCGTVGDCRCTGSSQQVSQPHMSDLHFFAVYDGHGGSQVAAFCKEHLHRALEEELTSHLGSARPQEVDAELQRALVSCFQKIDAQVGGFAIQDESSHSPSARSFVAPETVGSTAVVAVVGPNRIIVANCGDSRAVLSRGGRAIPLSKDHKPDRDDELARVEAAGGRVIFWNGYRVLGVLAMSRAIGDRYLKPYIIPEPDVTCTDRSEEDECLILASDGLWDVLSNDMVCEIARRCLSGRHRSQATADDREESAADMAAGLLTKVAIAKGSGDNISVVVVDLRSSSKKKKR